MIQIGKVHVRERCYSSCPPVGSAACYQQTLDVLLLCSWGCCSRVSGCNTRQLQPTLAGAITISVSTLACCLAQLTAALRPSISPSAQQRWWQTCHLGALQLGEAVADVDLWWYTGLLLSWSHLLLPVAALVTVDECDTSSANEVSHGSWAGGCLCAAGEAFSWVVECGMWWGEEDGAKGQMTAANEEGAPGSRLASVDRGSAKPTPGWALVQ